MQEEEKKASAKPDIEYFYGLPIKGFCGACGRCLFLTKRDQTKEDLEKLVTSCKYCGCGVDWESQAGRLVRLYG